MDLVENSIGSIIGHTVAWTYQLPVECSMFSIKLLFSLSTLPIRADNHVVLIQQGNVLVGRGKKSLKTAPLEIWCRVRLVSSCVRVGRHQHKAGRTVSDHHRRSQVAPWLIAQELESVQKIATMKTANIIPFFGYRYLY